MSDDEDEWTAPETLAQYTPDEDEVLGTEEEREQIGNRSLEIISGVPPKVPLDFTPSSTAKEGDAVMSDENTEQRHTPSTRQTTFDPTEGTGSVNYHRLNEIDHSTGEDEKADQRERHRHIDIHILADHFDLDDTEQYFIAMVNEETDLAEHGKPRYEALLLAALRYCFRAKRNWALKPSSVGTHEEYSDVYETIRQSWQCDSATVDTLYTYVSEEFDNCL